ncbi:MAG: ATP-binding protein [bacterium]
MKKKFRSLQVKFMLVVMFCILFAISILVALYLTDNLKERRLLKDITCTNKIMVQATMDDYIRHQGNLTKDYAVWDDMYTSVQSNDSIWVVKNIDPVIINFKKDMVGVYSANGRPIHVISRTYKNLITPDFIKKLDDVYGSFFVIKDSILFHVSWSIITKTSDTERKLSGIGYFFVAEVWDDSFISELEKKTGLDITIHSSSDFVRISRIDTSFLTIHYPIYNVYGKEIARIHFQTKNIYFFGERLREFIFICAFIFAGIIFSFFGYYVKRNIIQPIKFIIKSLKTGDVHILKTIQSDRLDDEWDIIVHLVKDHFDKNKKLEEQTQELKDLVATKDKFFDLMAHDLRSPFNAIMGFSSMLVEEEQNLSEEDKKDYVHHILSASEGAHSLLNTLTEWARLQTGRWVSNPHIFSFNKLLDNVVSFHQSNAIHNKIHLLVDCKEDYVVCADEQMIETVLRNLISNAIKFTQLNGFVQITTKKSEKEIIVTIADNGKGIPPEILSSLFKIGENVILKDVSGKKGTGLGLILCDDLVKKNGGKIWVESELDKGSTFHFTLPLSV